MDKVTIIVPIYNVEKYLRKSIESTINQTYENIEVILIDDGSTDNSGIICEEYQKLDSRVKVIHKENGGLSSARNVGLDNCTGRFIMFLDSDDFLELDAVEKMCKEIQTKEADYVIGNYINCTEEGEKWDKPYFDLQKYNPFKLDINDYQNSFFIMNSSVCNKIFRKEFIDKLNLRFIVGLPAEDAIFTTYCFINSKKVYYTQCIVFNYRQRKSGSISSNCSVKYFDGINKAYRIIYDNFKNNNCLGYYRYFYAKSMNYITFKFVDSKLLNKDERKSIIEKMSWFYSLTIELEVPPCHDSIGKLIDLINSKEIDKALEYCNLLQRNRADMTMQEKEKISKPDAETYQKISILDSKYRQ